MHPAYGWTDSYPYHANTMHYSPRDDPRTKEISSHMKMDPSTLNSPYQPWSYGGNCCYPVPQGCHGCYNHGYFGGPFSFRPPYPHYPTSPFHTHGLYPPFPGAYPAYSVPPPHYSVEQPRYDYDKKTHDSHHSCGCNHLEDEKKSRTEREEPEVDKNTRDSLVPSLLKDYPYPIMWVAPDFMNTKSKPKEEEKYSHVPASLKPLEPSKQGGNGGMDLDQQGKDGNGLPFPIFWFPSKSNELGKDMKEKNLDLASDDKGRLTKKNDEVSGSEAESEMSSKHGVQKVIPVKQLGTEEEKESLKSEETKVKSSSMEGKASPKTSKLPPVCLRIDPLPRHKKSSRSPSPGDKGRSKESPTDKSKSSQQQKQLSESLKKSKEEQSESNIKTIEVKNDTNKIEIDSLAGQFENGPGQSSETESCKSKKNLSEHEAALIIQSAYRGFEVRKSNPISKLRQIAGVGKQVVELRNRIQDLESSSSIIFIDDKQKLIIGETIMRLLLKLDTIQGLHPIVRDARKSVAKELVDLQEKLDSVTLIKPETPSEYTTKSAVHREDDAIQEKPDPLQNQSDKNVKSGTGLCENGEVEATESQDEGGSESRDTNLEPQAPLQNEEVNNNEVGVSVESEQPLDDVIQDKFDGEEAKSERKGEIRGVDDEDREVMETPAVKGIAEMPLLDTGEHVEVREEKEKMLEELMKSWKEQVDEIKELTGRVKDLEKQLSKRKKKKKMKGKKWRSDGCVVEDG